MYKLGRFVGNLFKLALYAAIVYDGVRSFNNEESFALNIIAFVFIVASKEFLKAFTVNAQATEYIAFHLYEQSQKAANKKDAINNIFNNITKDF